MAIVHIHDYDVMIDDKDVNRVLEHNWWVHTHKSADRYIYFRACINNKYVYLHRFIMGANDPDIVVDHINHNTLDNTSPNLRLCSKRENLINRKSIVQYGTIYVGVAKKETREYGILWGAHIDVHGSRIPLGIYHSPEAAARAYDIANIHHNGTIIHTNFPLHNYSNVDIDNEYKKLIHNKKFVTNKSGYRGVSWSNKRNKWTVHIVHRYKQIVVGYFTDVEDAAKAYDKKAKELGKPKSYLNFPEEI